MSAFAVQYSNCSAPFNFWTMSALELPCERHAIPMPLKICAMYKDKIILITGTTVATACCASAC